MSGDYSKDGDWAGLMIRVNHKTGLATVETISSRSADKETVAMARKAGDLLRDWMRDNPDPQCPAFEGVKN